MAIGNILMVLMKASIAQVRSPKFSTAGHYQSGPLQMRSARTGWRIQICRVAFSEVSSWRADGIGVKPAPAFDKISVSQPLALPGQRFVARQPIFDRSQNVYGYEILFRNGVENFFNADPELAARSTVDSSLLFGIDTLCDHKRAFMNCTREVLFKDLITLLPPGQTVAEILESVEPEDRVIAACKRLRAAGYRIALDDFAPDDPRIRWSSLPTSSKSTFAPPGLRNELA